MDMRVPGSRSTAGRPSPAPRHAASSGQVPWSLAALAVAAVAAAAVWGGPLAAALSAVVAVAGLAVAGRAQPTAKTGGVVDTGNSDDPRANEEPMQRPARDPVKAVVFYRPLRSLPELHLRGIEAEPRWCRPGEEPLPPSGWPATMDAETAAALLDACLDTALPQFAHWLPDLRTRGSATLWLRLPPAWLGLPAFASRLTQALAASGLDPSCLVLRVPLHADGRQAKLPDAVLALQARGVTLAVDAFGAGSASLTHLDRLPVRTVCLAQSFVERAGPTTPQRWVVESTARLAASMGMSTLAEGVTQESQVLALAVLGCNLGVGDVCGPWLPAPDCAAGWSGTQAVQAA